MITNAGLPERNLQLKLVAKPKVNLKVMQMQLLFSRNWAHLQK